MTIRQVAMAVAIEVRATSGRRRSSSSKAVSLIEPEDWDALRIGKRERYTEHAGCVPSENLAWRKRPYADTSRCRPRLNASLCHRYLSGLVARNIRRRSGLDD